MTAFADQIMLAEEYKIALVHTDAKYSTLADFYGLPRRTTHRWITSGVPNTVARFLQLIMALDMTLDDARILIAESERQGDGWTVPVAQVMPMATPNKPKRGRKSKLKAVD